MQEIIVKISPSGATSIEANGFSGDVCTKETHALEMVLSGGGPVDKSPKPEYYQPQTENQEVKSTF